MSPDLIGRIARAIPDIARPLIKLDLSKVFPALTSVTRTELEKAISRNIAEKRLYLFIDDTDQVANPEKVGHLNRIWALILAVRMLTQRVSEIRAVVTLRSEVWDRLKSESVGQRDQTDHFTSLCIRLSSDEEHIRRIISRRLSFAAAACHYKYNDFYEFFFEGKVARAPNSEDYRSWEDLILVRSRLRPRDAIQLINSLADKAISLGTPKITEDHFRAVMPSFSESRATLFGQEVERECPTALEIVRSFA